MKNELSNLQQQIQEALQLLQESEVFAPEHQNNVHGALPATDVFFAEHSSLLDKCSQVCAQYQEQKPTIRIIHHLACSGGTLISKCLSVMPNTYLLSEVHPYTDLHLGNGKPKFSPSDISSLSKYANIFNIKPLLNNIFLRSIIETHDHIKSHGGSLILRDHTHSDFHVGEHIKSKSSVVNALSNHFDIKSILTFRDPIDSYLSLKKNGWLHFTPATFDEYCQRIVEMLETYKSTPVFHYEDFVENPQVTLINICKSLSIDYDENWISFFDIANVTGDSGRSGFDIFKRPRREIDNKFRDEIISSEPYEKIRSKFQYSKFATDASEGI